MTIYTAGLALHVTKSLGDRRFQPIRNLIESILRDAAHTRGFEFYSDRGPNSLSTHARIVIGDVYDWAAANPTVEINI